MGEIRRRVGVRASSLHERGEEGRAADARRGASNRSAWSCAETGREALGRAMGMVSDRLRGGGGAMRSGKAAGRREHTPTPVTRSKVLTASLPVVILSGVLLYVALSVLPFPLTCQSSTVNPATTHPTADCSSLPSSSAPPFASLLRRLPSLIASLPCITATAAVTAAAAVAAASVTLLLLRTLLRLLLTPLLPAVATALSSHHRAQRLLGPLAALLSLPPRLSRPRHRASVGIPPLVGGPAVAKGKRSMGLLLSLAWAMMVLSLTLVYPAIVLLVVALQLLLSSQANGNRWVQPQSQRAAQRGQTPLEGSRCRHCIALHCRHCTALRCRHCTALQASRWQLASICVP